MPTTPTRSKPFVPSFPLETPADYLSTGGPSSESKQEPATSLENVDKGKGKGESTSTLLARRNRDAPRPLTTLKTSTVRQQSSNRSDRLIPKERGRKTPDMPPSAELHQYQVMRAGSVDLDREKSTHTPLTSTIQTPRSAADYEAKRAEMINAGIATDFQELQLERSLDDSKLPAEGSKVILGSGATSTVYEVKLDHSYDHPYGKSLAFKQILDPTRPPSYIRASLIQTDPSVRNAKMQMLLHEEKRKILNEYSHLAAVNYIDQIPKVYGLFELDGGLGILMEKVSGPELGRLQPFAQTAVAHKVITSNDYLQASLRAIADILIALGEMHSRSLTQSDIKPANVMWDDESLMFKLMDHGGGRQIGEKMQVFTPGYGQISGSSKRDLTLADPSSDIHQAGQTLHFLLTGKTAGTRHFDNESNESSISFIKVLQDLSDTKKSQLVELLNGMISPETEEQNLRKSAKELLESPLFNNLKKRAEIGEILDKVNKWAEGEL